MQTLIVKTESEAATKLLLAFLKTVRLVKSVTLFSPETNTSVVNESSEAYNWTNPSRPATDEEFELMIAEAEAEEGIPAEEARALTMKKLAEWRKQNRK